MLDGNRERDALHNVVRDETAAMARSAGLDAVVEPSGVLLHSGKRPDWIIPDFFGPGRMLLVDVGIVGATRTTLRAGAAVHQGFAAEAKEKSKKEQ